MAIAKSFAVACPIKPLVQEVPRCGQVAISRTRNNLTLLFHSLQPPPPVVTSRTSPGRASPVPPPAYGNDHLHRLRRLCQRHHHLLVLPPPLTHPISLALSAAITGQLARSIYLPSYGGAPRLGLIGNGPIFGISAHSLRDPPPRGSPLVAHGLQPLERGVQPGSS